jgi:hypothetical protein
VKAFSMNISGATGGGPFPISVRTVPRPTAWVS